MHEQTAFADDSIARAPPSIARILVVDDEPDACEVLRQALSSEGYAATAETSALRALERVGSEEFDLVVSDVTMKEMNGLDLCRHLVAVRAGMPVILVTGRGTMETAIGALRSGARDFLTKPVDLDSLVVSVVRALQHRVPAERNAVQADVESGSAAARTLASILGRSVPIRTLRELIVNLAGSTASVVVQGETGTGKELVARALHANSRFKEGPFVALNCAAMPAGLLESELFGHARGAFTDAKAAKTGLLVRASGGTLLLDEINEMPLEMQPKLLRALQERTVRPLGESREVPFECRIVAATNVNLDAEIAAKRFREDLYYRLDVVRLTVPPLRDRGDDIRELAQHFLARQSSASRRKLTLSPELVEKLMIYAWPGNVRELENCIERAVALACGDALTPEDLSEKIRFADGTAGMQLAAASGARLISLVDLERRHTLRALDLLQGNMTRAAKLLGIDRTTLYRRLKRYEAGEPS